MGVHPLRIVTVTVAEDTAAALRAKLEHAHEDVLVTGEVIVQGAEDFEGFADADLAVVEAEGNVASIIRTLVGLQRVVPTLPILLAVSFDEFAESGLINPEDGLVSLSDGLFVLTAPVTDSAFLPTLCRAWSTLSTRPSRVPPLVDVADNEIRSLRAACGPSPVQATSRMLGGHTLRDNAFEHFQSAIRDYEALLERAMVAHTHDVEDTTSEDLQALADRLGSLNSGPRDVIDIHRYAIGQKIRGQPAQKAKAYVGEGRLVLVQLMGYLVSFYRSLSWGGRRSPQPRKKL